MYNKFSPSILKVNIQIFSEYIFTEYIHIHTSMHPLYALLPMCPITHVPHLELCIIMAMCPITPVPHHPVPYVHVPLNSCALFCPCAPLPYPHFDLDYPYYPHYPYAPSPLFPWLMGHIGDGAAKCQVVKKMSNVKKSNTWTMEEVHKK